MPHPPLFAGVATTSLPLVSAGPVPAETDGEDAGASSAAEERRSRGVPTNGRRSGTLLCERHIRHGGPKGGGRARAGGAAGEKRMAVRVRETKQLKGLGWGSSLRRESYGSTGCGGRGLGLVGRGRRGKTRLLGGSNTNVIKEGVLRPFTTYSQKGKARSKIKCYQVTPSSTSSNTIKCSCLIMSTRT